MEVSKTSRPKIWLVALPCLFIAASHLAGCRDTRPLEPKAGGGPEEEWVKDGATRLAWSRGKGTARLVLEDGSQRFSFPLLVRADADAIAERMKMAWEAQPSPEGPKVVAKINAGRPEIEFVVEPNGEGRVVRMHMHDNDGPPGVSLELTEARYAAILERLEAAKPDLKE